MNKFNINFLISTFFGIGKLPSCIVYVIASLIALPVTILCICIGNSILKFLFPTRFPYQEVLSAIFVLTVLAMIATKSADAYSKKIRSKDPREVIIDEIVGQALCFLITIPWTAVLIILPNHPLPFLSQNVLLMLAIILNIILFRLFDTFKPWPINKFEQIKGGLGIMLDDIVAAIYAAIIYFLIIFVI